jgi:phospholipase C
VQNTGPGWRATQSECRAVDSPGTVQPTWLVSLAVTEPVNLSRRTLLGGALAGAAAIGLAPGVASAGTRTPSTVRSRSPRPGSLPNPDAPAGTDQIPLVDNIVIVMLENHSYDNILGMMRGRGDGFVLGPDGRPTASNPWPKQSTFPPPSKKAVVHAFPMPNPCQEAQNPWNTWEAFKVSFAEGDNSGFVKSQSGPVSMGYFEPSLLPFTNSLANTFPVCDRYFCSVGAQTYPNRRYLMGGTSLGQTRNILNNDRPPNGTMFEALNAHGISWKNYYSSLPSLLIWTYLGGLPNISSHLVNISNFFTDAAAGTLPAVSLVDPEFGKQSEENPQDVQFGEQFLAQVVNAVMASPQWPNTMLVWCYDESGGYYDHVPPPRAVKPDGVAPVLSAGDKPGAFNRYGFRVPAGVVSPYARPDYVSHVVHDHTSILKLVESKWNLPALTRRDAHADNLLDTVDLPSPPAFLTPPSLASAPDPNVLAGCLSTGPGTIPPAGYVTTG